MNQPTRASVVAYAVALAAVAVAVVVRLLFEPLLAGLTGWGQDEDKRRAEQAGFDHHMVKPVDPAVLEKVLGRSAR